MAVVESSLALHVEQITDGFPACSSCDMPARWMIGNGADPEPEPYCHEHAAEWLDLTAGLVRKLR